LDAVWKFHYNGFLRTYVAPKITRTAVAELSSVALPTVYSDDPLAYLKLASPRSEPTVDDVLIVFDEPRIGAFKQAAETILFAIIGLDSTDIATLESQSLERSGIKVQSSWVNVENPLNGLFGMYDSGNVSKQLEDRFVSEELVETLKHIALAREVLETNEWPLLLDAEELCGGEIREALKTSTNWIGGEPHYGEAKAKLGRLLKRKGLTDTLPTDFNGSRKWSIDYFCDMLIARNAKAALQNNAEPTVSIDGLQYEKEIADKLRELDFIVSATPASGDYGADLIAEKHELRIAVQVKSGATKTGVAAVQEAFSASHYYKTDFALVISRSEFTNAAVTMAAENSVILLRAERLGIIDTVIPW
jgi:hypothetical protein